MRVCQSQPVSRSHIGPHIQRMQRRCIARWSSMGRENKVVAYSFANMPLNAAHPPLAKARTIHWFRAAQLGATMAGNGSVSAVSASRRGRLSSWASAMTVVSGTGRGTLFFIWDGRAVEPTFVPAADETDCEESLVGSGEPTLPRWRRRGIVSGLRLSRAMANSRGSI
jgi:hypothetical protein